MKNRLFPSFVLGLLLSCLLVLVSGTTVFAEAAIPTIETQMEDFILTTDQAAAVLTVSASVPDGGTLSYQWYSASDAAGNGAAPISGATGSSYTPPVKEGNFYFFAKIWNTLGEEISAEVQTRVACVTYTAPEPPQPEILAVKVEAKPNKLTYTVGESLDLTGLRVRVYLKDGTELLSDGADVQIDCPAFDSAGKKTVTVTYEGFSDSFTVNVEEQAEPHTHSFGAWTVETEASCTSDGKRVRKCECGETESERISATGHDYDSGTITKEATEEEDGIILYTCQNCGNTKTGRYEMHEHTFGEWAVTKEATCTEEGQRVRTCSCGYEESEVIAKTGHRLDSGVIEVEATEENEGRMVYTCSLCGETTVKTIAKLPSSGEADTDPLPTPPDEQSGFPWWNLFAILSLLAAAGLLIFYLYQEKKGGATGKKTP